MNLVFLWLYEGIFFSFFMFAKLCAKIFCLSLTKKFLEMRSKPKNFHVDSCDLHVVHAWIHVASAGELEQAIPIMRALGERQNFRFLLTYFSPSTEPFLKNAPYVVKACPLPLDMRKNYEPLFAQFQPKHLFFVRYDLWPALIFEAKRLKVSIHLLAATQRATRTSLWQYVSQMYKNYLLKNFTTIFTVSEKDLEYFRRKNLKAEILYVGDAKWARAKERAQLMRMSSATHPAILAIKKLVAMKQSSITQPLMRLVWGSPHAEEHLIALHLAKNLPEHACLFYVPHKIDETSIHKVLEDFHKANVSVFRISQYLADKSHDPVFVRTKVWIIDLMGVLAELYGLADVAIIGGGFDGQIHNTLEAAAHGISTLFGGNVQRAPEAELLLARGAALAFSTPQSLQDFLGLLLQNDLTSQKKLQEVALQAQALFREIPDTPTLVCNYFAAQHKIVEI